MRPAPLPGRGLRLAFGKSQPVVTLRACNEGSLGTTTGGFVARVLTIAVSIGLTTALSGCSIDRPFSSRWAMDDPDYAAKYSHRYEEKGKLLRMAKQAVDARFVAGKSGTQTGAVFLADPFYAGGELGVFGYSQPWLSGHLSLAALAADDRWTAGVDFGTRAEIPARISPFVGLGVYTGYREQQVDAHNDGLDNDDDDRIDEWGEQKSEIEDAMAAVYPEVGLHAWLTSQWRITGSARYYITTNGRQHDAWVFGVSLGCLFGSDSSEDTE